MSAALHLGRPEDLERLAALVAAFHEEAGIALEDAARREALVPLLEGGPHGAAYLIGPARAPIGYVLITFGWSVSAGGLEAKIDEIFVRPGVRGRGVASEVLRSLPRALKQGGVRALRLEADRDDARMQVLCTRAGLAAQPQLLVALRRL